MLGELVASTLNEIASVPGAHSNSWQIARTILSHRQQRPTPQPRPPSRHGLPRNTDNMAEITKELTFKAVQIDALVRATRQRENPAGRPAILLFAATRSRQPYRQKADSGL